MLLPVLIFILEANLTLQVPSVTNINFHLTISIHNQRENASIFKQILTTNFSSKCMEISLENLYVDNWGLKGQVLFGLRQGRDSPTQRNFASKCFYAMNFVITPPEKGCFKEMAQNGQHKGGYLFYDLYSMIHNNCISQSWKSMKQVALKLLVWKAEQSEMPSFPPLHNGVAEFYTLPAKAG